MQAHASPSPTVADSAFAFGSFLLYPERHLLLKNDEPVTIGSRALEILIALTEHAGELATKDELTARAWPNATVEESNLRAQIALLRRVLGDDQAAPRYIVAVPSRGYRFIAPLTRSHVEHEPQTITAPNNLPRQLTHPIGLTKRSRSSKGDFNGSVWSQLSAQVA
ncbi:transcriptional regulator [Mesorhizobium sp. M0938]|uniref:winged helix-turn-helix domain-containing protein n=1 Tax=unclassified Mesorhizobium TaxID=325217 RepID=UPI003339D795